MSGEKKADLKRDGTMQVTAKEAVQFLMGTGDKDLLEMQGLVVPQGDGSSSTAQTEAQTGKEREKKTPSKPRLPRDSTMVVTAKEGERYLKESWGAAEKEDAAEEPCKPKLAKYTTMLQTKQEGEAFVSAQGGLDEDAKTRNQQEKLEKMIDEPAAKKCKTTAEDVPTEGKRPSPKRVSTIVQTAKEGEELLKELGHKDDNPDSDRRRTRSQTRGGPPPPPPAKRDRSSSGEKESKGEEGKTRARGRPKKNAAKGRDEKLEGSKKEGETRKSVEDDEEEEDEEEEEEEEEEEDEVVKTDDEKVVNDAKTKD